VPMSSVAGLRHPRGEDRVRRQSSLQDFARAQLRVRLLRDAFLLRKAALRLMPDEDRARMLDAAKRLEDQASALAESAQPSWRRPEPSRRIG
jgi:urease accessory protein UreF